MDETNDNLSKSQTALEKANKTLEEGDASVSQVRRTLEETESKHAEEIKKLLAQLEEER